MGSEWSPSLQPAYTTPQPTQSEISVPAYKTTWRHNQETLIREELILHAVSQFIFTTSQVSTWLTILKLIHNNAVLPVSSVSDRMNFSCKIRCFRILLVKSSILWDITACSPLKVNQSFGGTCRFLFQGRKINQAISQHEASWLTLRLWISRWHVPQKCRLTFTGFRTIISQKVVPTSMKTSDHTYYTHVLSFGVT
jgi:hypothetical protein